MTNTYVELLTDLTIREYVNDELISERPNPVGCIPIVHIQNAPAQGSAWGLSDIWEILGTNREYNEKMTEILGHHQLSRQPDHGYYRRESPSTGCRPQQDLGCR